MAKPQPRFPDDAGGRDRGLGKSRTVRFQPIVQRGGTHVLGVVVKHDQQVQERREERLLGSGPQEHGEA
jgi:hypothetical protein